MSNLDKTDLQLLRLLQEDCRLTTKELAAKVNLSSTPVYDRVKRLEREGYIKKYVAILDYEKLNRGFAVFCNVKLKQLSATISNDFISSIQEIPEVIECYNISGEYDYLLKVQVPDMKRYQHFLLHILGKLESIGGIHSIFIMDNIKQAYDAHIADLPTNTAIEYYI